jgi:hypothetical protein
MVGGYGTVSIELVPGVDSPDHHLPLVILHTELSSGCSQGPTSQCPQQTSWTLHEPEKHLPLMSSHTPTLPLSAAPVGFEDWIDWGPNLSSTTYYLCYK